jgi:hypothetical protein
MHAMKNVTVIQLRMTDELKDAFAGACARAGITQSDALRQLCEAAVAYIDGLGGRWWPPKIEPADAPGKGGRAVVYAVQRGPLARVAEAKPSSGRR